MSQILRYRVNHFCILKLCRKKKLVQEIVQVRMKCVGLLVMTGMILVVSESLDGTYYPPVDLSCFKRATQVFCSSHSTDTWTRCLSQLTKVEDLVYVNATALCLSTVTQLCIVDDFCQVRPDVHVRFSI